MLERKRTVLFVEWSTSGRDLEIDLPLMYFFERYLGWKSIYASIFNLPKLLSTEPDLIIMSNTTGALENVRMSRIIEQSGIPFFSHVSEGMFRESDIEEFVWGWNKSEKKFSELSSGVWSKKSFEMALKAYPQLSGFYQVTGSVGFDKYAIYSHDELNTGKFTKVIGYAAFDFNNIQKNKENFIRTRSLEFYEKLMGKAKEINGILKYIVQENPDVLFLMKAHPGDGENYPMEIKGLQGTENVRILDRGIGIVQAISNSDIWLNYNSTTNLEAWLLNKPTISFNIEEENFSSDILYGSITETNKENIHEFIKEFYRDGCITEFENKKKRRHKLVSDYIGFPDGMNHVRFMSFLKTHIDMINSGKIQERPWKVSTKLKLRGYIRHFLFSLSSKLSCISLFVRLKSL